MHRLTYINYKKDLITYGILNMLFVLCIYICGGTSSGSSIMTQHIILMYYKSYTLYLQSQDVSI